MVELVPYPIEQQRHVNEVIDLLTVLAPLQAESRDLVGGMQWKTIRGHEYLYRYAPDPVTKKKRSTSLGRRSAETEAIYRRFRDRRARIKDELPRLEALAATQVRVSKALRLGRISRATGDFLNLLAGTDLSTHMVLIGDFAAYGFETMFLHEIPVMDAPAPEFMLQDDVIADDLLAEMRQVFPDMTAKQHRSGTIMLGAGDVTAKIWPRTAWMQQLEQNAGDQDRFACIEQRLEAAQLAAIVFDRAGRPAPVSVPDALAYAMIACTGNDELDLGPALAEIAVATGRYELEDYEADAFPEIATRIGGFGLRI